MIRLTWISEGVTGKPREYDTDSIGEAVAQFLEQSFRSGDGDARDPYVFAVVVERDDERLSPAELVKSLRRIAGVQELHEHRRQSEEEEKGDDRKARP